MLWSHSLPSKSHFHIDQLRTRFFGGIFFSLSRLIRRIAALNVACESQHSVFFFLNLFFVCGATKYFREIISKFIFLSFECVCAVCGAKMIKGKFYTGLPEKMMNRSRGMDRQQTHFYWPDESKAEETPSRKVRPTKAKASPMTSATVNNSSTTASDDIKPKELFHKQLSSRIEFYDNVDAKTPEARRRRFKKIDNVNLNNLNNADSQYVPEKKKLETFSSKIEFYDFVDATKPATEVKRNNAAVIEPIKQKQKIEIDDEPIRKPIERTDSMKKRISFQVEKVSPEKTKSILKNVDKSQPEKIAVKPLPKRGLLPKNMSKSVDNMSKLAKNTEDLNEKNGVEPDSEKLISIIREVKNMNLNEQKQPLRSSMAKSRYADDDNDDDYGYSRAGNRRTNYQRGDDYGRRERERIGDERRYNRRYEDRYDDEPVYDHYEERPYRREPPPRSSRAERFDDRPVGRSPQRIDNDYYESHSNRYDYPDSRRTPPGRRYNDIDDRSPRQSRIVPIEVKPYAEIDRPIPGRSTPNRNRYEDRPIERKPVDRGQRAYSEQPTAYSPADSGRSHRHLRSNIFFNDDNRQPTKRPLSVRDSAVTRVGVGLPDI